MSHTTPKRPGDAINTGYSSVTLLESPAAASPQKNLTGLPRVVRDLAADVYNTVQRWNGVHIEGASLVKEIAAIKSNDPNDFSQDLEQLANSLYNLIQSLKAYKDDLQGFAKQIRSAEKLQAEPGPLFVSLHVNSLAILIEHISEAYTGEFDLKETVLENIPYSKCADEAMFLAALWIYQTRITDKVNLELETLLIETGHRKVS